MMKYWNMLTPEGKAMHTLPEKPGGGGAEDVPGLPGIHEAIQRAKEKPLTSAHANGPKKKVSP